MHGSSTLAIFSVLLGITTCCYPSNAQQSTTQLEGIIVTANKREQKLDQVDGGVSVRSAEQLRAAGVTTVAELEKAFPGLVVRSRGNRAYASFTVRGVSSTDFYSPSVQIFVDGVPQSEAFFTQELVNVERVEFLRGPQGTLYGRNAYAGVINIISRNPDRTTGSVQATVSSKHHGLEVAATAAVVPGTLFVDMSGLMRKDKGQIDDLDTGDEGIDQGDIVNGTAKLRYMPEDSPVQVTVQVARDQTDTHEETYMADARAGSRRYSATAGDPAIGELNRRTTTGALNWSYDFGAAKLTSTTAYQELAMDRQVFGFEFPEAKDTWSQEVRLEFSADSVDGVVGAYYQSDEFTREFILAASKNQVDTETAAVFGEATWHITGALDVTAGARYSYDKASIDFQQINFGPYEFSNNAKFESGQYKGAIGYEVAPELRVYGQVSTGYKPGGFNHAVTNPSDVEPYEPEEAINYEVGARGVIGDGAFTYALAAFRINATDKQIYVGTVPNQVIRNAAETSSTGAEAEFNWQVTPQFDLSGNVTYSRTVFEEFTNDGVDLSDNVLPYSPDWTGSIQARYALPATFGVPITLIGAAHYTSEIFFDEQNSLSQDGVVLFDAAVELDLLDSVKLKVFGNNITDEAYSVYRFQSGPVILNNVGEGRVVGAKLRADF